MLILGIESTCDETGAAIVRDGRDVLANVVSTQIDLQSTYGGVVPELACRRHIDVIIPVIEQATRDAGVSLEEIDVIAVAKGPGLIGALLIGINTAKTLALALKKPFIGINHVEAHLYAALMSYEKPPSPPTLGVVLSGGHTTLAVMEEVGAYRVVGQTVDDALGEAFDKVAKILGLPYPGGPEVERLAKTGNPDIFTLKAGKVKGQPLSFSFSGLKTGVLYTAKGPKASQKSPLVIADEEKRHLAAAFQETALHDIVAKACKAAEQYGCRSLALGGGVTNNKRLRELFEAACVLPLFWPKPAYTLDNAAMIAGLAYHQYQRQGAGDPLDLEAATRLAL